jgi:hypothetical protein
MGRSDIAEYGKRFTSEYQPARRGRPKGSRNRRTILRAYLEEREPPPPEEVIRLILEEVFGRKTARRIRRGRKMKT